MDSTKIDHRASKLGVNSMKNENKIKEQKETKYIFPLDREILDPKSEIDLEDLQDVLNPTGKTPSRIYEE